MQFILIIFLIPFTNSLYSHIDSSSILSMQLSPTPSQRKLQDGRDCSSAFVQDGRTYTDCTSSRSPDGRMTRQEWCYADNSQKAEGGYPSWGYCVPVLNYDKVREKAKDLLGETLPEIRKVGEIVSVATGPCSNAIDLLEKVESKQGENDIRSSMMEKQLKELEKGFQNLLGLKAKCEGVLQGNELLEKEIEQLKNRKSGGLNKNCEGLLGYDEEREGDGIMGEFYDNEGFLGTSEKNIVENIDFQWLGRAPLAKINSENFSFKFNGYLKVPVDGYYRFTAGADDGFILYLNDQLLVDAKEKNQRTNQATSEELYLIGGLKYHLQYIGSHSVHNTYYENSNAYSKLLWESSEFTKEIIPVDYFYLGNKQPPLKLFGYQSKNFILRNMREFDDAFKNTAFFKMADIPLQFRNLNQLRSDLHYIESEINLQANAPITIYVAVNARLPNPLPSDFQNTEEILSILKLPKNFRTPNNEIRASLSIPFRIYKKNFPEGLIKIPLTVSKEKKYRLSFLLFYQVNSIAARHFICGGKESNIGLYNSGAFESCSSSSAFPNNQWNCEYAFSGRMIDGPFTMWASNGEGIGAWIEISFKQEYQIIGIELKNRDNPGERNKEIELKYSNGETVNIALKNTDRVISLPINPVVTKSIRLTILSVYGTINNGVAFNIIGLPCKIESSLQGIHSDDPVNLRCDHNLINHEQLMKMNFQIGDRFKAACSVSCIDQAVNIYGSLIYSEDSSLCKAAYHMGVISAGGGVFSVLIGPSQLHYNPETRNGITSDMKISSPRSVTFEAIQDEKSLLINGLFLGMKVDIFDSQLKNWSPGMVIRIDNRQRKNCKVLVSKEGYSAEFNENINWPDPQKIDYCGERIPLRICDEKSKSPKKNMEFEAKICFTPKSECPSGYLPDSGDQYNEKGSLSYGWSGDMRMMSRSRYNHFDALLDNLMLFPPDKNSKWCLIDRPITICEPMHWIIKVPNGKYVVKITVGDPNNKAGYWIKVNGKVFIDGKILEKNQFYSPSFEVNVGDERIKVTADCDRDCKYIWSRINAIEIRSSPSNYVVFFCSVLVFSYF